jgi:hypothetical protein
MADKNEKDSVSTVTREMKTEIIISYYWSGDVAQG